MNKILSTLKKYMPTKRKIMQLYFALLFNANIKGFISGKIYYRADGTKFLCAPGINCYSCPGAVTACPLGSLQGSFDNYENGAPTIVYICGILLLYSILFGRMICGWMCPFGLIQDLLYKIKSPKLKKSPVTRILSFMKYAILVFFVLVVPITYAIRKAPTPAFCKYICPAGTIEGGLLLLSNKVNDSFFSMLGPLFTWKFLLMVSIMVGCVFIFRVFCRFICPLGGLYGLFNKISCFGVKVDEEKCTHCNLCVAHCKVDIKHVGDQECISCGECIDVCPTKAIFWKGSKIFLKANACATDADPEEAAAAKTKQEKQRLITRVVTAVVMVAVLIGAIVYYWNTTPDLVNPTEPPVSTSPSGPAAEPGNEPGNLLPGGTLPIVTADGVSDQTIDPTATGKITIINFWGTWCGPCVAELPYFDQIAKEYADTVTVVAIHTDLLSEDAPGFIEENYPDSPIIFAKDDFDSTYFLALGGLGNYPHTVIIDENGIVQAKFARAVEYEELKEVVDAAFSGPVQIGSEPGNKLPAASLPIIAADGLSSATLDPTTTGKITVINFWGTWCGPCVAELPYFDQIAREYADTVNVVAIHTDLLNEDAPAFILENYPDSPITFAKDDEESTYFFALGGLSNYPHTVIIDENGIVLAKFARPVEYEELKAVIDNVLQ